MSVSMKKKKSAKLKCGYECLIGVFVVLALLVVVCNVMIASHRTTAQIAERSKDEERMASPKVPMAIKRLQRTQQKEKSTIQERQQQKETQAVKAKRQKREPQMHVVFSTSCSTKHDWQAYVFFFQAMIHQQPGNVTRLVSGCSPQQEAELLQYHQEKIAIMNDRFHVHFTPEFGKREGFSFQQTKYWNKPFGVKHWLENKFGYRYEGDISTPHDDDIIVLVDPDMLMQRAFENDFSKFPISIWQSQVQKNPENIYHKITHGYPMAQDYSFGSSWLRAGISNLTYVLGTTDSPVFKVTNKEQSVYSAGPPYMLTARDMYRVSYHWADFLPRLFEVHQQFMDEMYGYCLSAAHLGLKHQIARGFMVSSVSMTNGEGWSFMDNVTDDACQVSKLKKTVPHVIHFCQRYSIGEYFLSKYKVPTEILTCDHPLFELPPLDIAANTNYSHYGDGSTKVWEGKTANYLYRHAFMVCSLMPAINQAATFFKDHHCPNGANYRQTWNTFVEAKAKMAEKCKTQGICPVVKD